jgi:hypothetical protein
LSGLAGAFYTNFFRAFADLPEPYKGDAIEGNGVVVAASPQLHILGAQLREHACIYMLGGCVWDTPLHEERKPSAYIRLCGALGCLEPVSQLSTIDYQPSL